jgi:hypothetical protein
MDAVYLGNWSDAAGMFKDFEEKPQEIEVIFAVYWYQDYEGSAFVLYRDGGKLFTVQGGHCSCNGLEGQWSPVEVTRESLLLEIEKGNLGRDRYDDEGNFADKLLEVLKQL